MDKNANEKHPLIRLGTPFQLEENVIQLLRGMEMSVVDCHCKSFFLTSDNPVVRTYPSANGKQDDEVWFPISYKRGILWHRRKPECRAGFGHSQTRAYNRRLIRYSYKYVYSPLREEWIEPVTNQEKYDPLIGHYGSLEQVIAHAKPAVNGCTGESLGEIVEVMGALRCGEKRDVVGV